MATHRIRPRPRIFWGLGLTLALVIVAARAPARLVAQAAPAPHLHVKADNTRALNVRPEPNTHHEPLGALAPQDRTRYAIVGKDAPAATWWQIRFRDAAGRAALGWVHGAYVEAYHTEAVPVTWPEVPAPDCGPPLPPFPSPWHLSFLPWPERYGETRHPYQPNVTWDHLEDVQTLVLNADSPPLFQTAGVALPRLQILILRDASLTTPPPLLSLPLPCLRELDLSGNQLATLNPGAFAGLSQLERLDLSGNQLATLNPGAFAGLSQLERLDLSGNQLATLDPALFAPLSQLKALFLSGNQLATLDPALFAPLSQLKDLFLSGNQLATLDPALFARLPQLERLDLSRNQLATLDPALFAPLSQLKDLFLNDNQLATLDPALFAPLSRLERLDLGGNQLATLDPAFVRPLAHLKYLDLSGNQLATLNPALFRPLSRLEILDLGGNQLACLPPDLFAGLDRLCALNLRGNRLGNVAPVFFQGLTRVKALILGGLDGPGWSVPNWWENAVRAYDAAAPCLQILHLTPDPSLSYPACGPPAAPRAPRAVRFGPGADRPQVGRPLVAQTVPADFPGAAWRWESCADAWGRACRDLTYRFCPKPVGPAPGPAQVYVPAPADEGRYLRAFLTYLAPDGVWTRLRAPLAGPVAPAASSPAAGAPPAAAGDPFSEWDSLYGLWYTCESYGLG